MATNDPTLGTVYQELCTGHTAIADFRAKLLALLPIASAGGIALLLNGAQPAVSGALLVAAGLFGVAITFGLFMYELRGINDCVALRARVLQLEEDLGIPVEVSRFGVRGRGGGKGLADEIGAAWIVYPAVMTAWLYVAAYGGGLDALTAGSILVPGYLVAVIAGMVCFRPGEPVPEWRRRLRALLAVRPERP
jgi:hypothetical protein